MICLVDSINMKKVVLGTKRIYSTREMMRDEPCLGNSSGKISFYSECGLSVICFYIYFLGDLKARKCLSNFAKHLCFYYFLLISCIHFALSILSIHGRQAPAYCLRVEPNSAFV